MLRLCMSLVLAVGTAVLTVGVADALPLDPPAGKKAKGKKEKEREKGRSDESDDKPSWGPMPPGLDARIQEILIDLRGQFNLMDSDVSWALDGGELARGFRGKDAQVPDWAAGTGGTSEQVKDRPTQNVIKEKFPDQYFLNAYDLDRDGRIQKKEFVDGYMRPVAAHFKDVFEKKDKVDAIALKLQAKGIDRAQKAKLQADMNILNANLRAGIIGFQHNLWMDRQAVRNAQWRTNYAWYQHYRK